MKDFSTMALVVTDNDRPAPKVWQPWYLEEGDDLRKELPSRIQREQRIRGRLALGNALRRSPSPEINVVDNASLGGYSIYPSYRFVPPPPHHPEDDLPLDMSTKKRSSPSPPPLSSPPALRHNFSPTPPPAHIVTHTHTPPPAYIIPHSPPPPAHTPCTTTSSSSPPPYTLHSSLRGRPSVITCASPRYLSSFQGYGDVLSLGDVPHAHGHRPHSPPSTGGPPPSYQDRLAPPPSYSAATAHLRDQKVVLLSSASPEGASAVPVRVAPAAHTPPSKGAASGPHLLSLIRSRSSPAVHSEEETPPRRQVVQASPADPEIDEHFRRSLGQNYHQLLVNGSDSDAQDSNDSVDDHFAKALGDTWVKIKACGSNGTSPKHPKDHPTPPLSTSAASLTQSSSSPTLINISTVENSPPPLIHKKFLAAAAAAAAAASQRHASRSQSPPTRILPDLPIHSKTLNGNADVSITRVASTSTAASTPNSTLNSDIRPSTSTLSTRLIST